MFQLFLAVAAKSDSVGKGKSWFSGLTDPNGWRETIFKVLADIPFPPSSNRKDSSGRNDFKMAAILTTDKHESGAMWFRGGGINQMRLSREIEFGRDTAGIDFFASLKEFKAQRWIIQTFPGPGLVPNAKYYIIIIDSLVLGSSYLISKHLTSVQPHFVCYGVELPSSPSRRQIFWYNLRAISPSL